MKALKPRQQAILNYVRAYWRDHGYAPSLRDIVEGCKLSSTSLANYHVGVLVEAGLLLREKGITRTIREA